MGERTVNSVGCVPGSAGLVPAQEARHGSHVLGHPRSHQLNSLKQPQHEQQLCEEEHRQDIIDTQDTINKVLSFQIIDIILGSPGVNADPFQCECQTNKNEIRNLLVKACKKWSESN